MVGAAVTGGGPAVSAGVPVACPDMDPAHFF